MNITVKQLSEHTGVGKRTINNYLTANNVSKLAHLGVVSFNLIGGIYILTMSKDFSLNDND